MRESGVVELYIFKYCHFLSSMIYTLYTRGKGKSRGNNYEKKFKNKVSLKINGHKKLVCALA